MIICSFVFINRFGSKSIVIIVYVEDLNIISTHDEIFWNCEISVKSLGWKILGNKCVKNNSTWIKHIHWVAQWSHSLSSTMIAKSFDVNKIPFLPQTNAKYDGYDMILTLYAKA